MIFTFLMPFKLVGMSLIGRLESRTLPAGNSGNVVPRLLAPAIQARAWKSHNGRGAGRILELSCHPSVQHSTPSQIPFSFIQLGDCSSLYKQKMRCRTDGLCTETPDSADG